jgi:hypothetical protein
MNSNIDISNIEKHFFVNLKHNGKNNNIKKYRTKIVDLSFYSKNEAIICDKIKNIPYYSNNFMIIEDYDFINISQLNGNLIEKLNINTSQNEKKYLIFKYKSENLVTFNDFLFHLLDHKQVIFHTIDSFSYILRNLQLLNDINVCFFNLSPQNIVFNFDCGEKPQLQNFQQSLQINALNEKYITNIIKNVSDFTHKPLEVHLLFYLIQNDMSTISYSFIEEICIIFVDKLSILSLFSEKYKDSYKQSCLESLKKYINMPKSNIISDILNQSQKWDVYSLSILYLHIFGNISRFFSLKSTFLNKITLELSKNIHPDPYKRSTLQNLLEKYEKIFKEENDWSFVNKIKYNNIKKLFDVLGN